MGLHVQACDSTGRKPQAGVCCNLDGQVALLWAEQLTLLLVGRARMGFISPG